MRNLAYLLLLVLIITSCSTKPTAENEFADAPEDTSEFVEYNNPPAEGFNLEGSDMLAVLLADKCMQAMGGRQAWDNTRYITWNFLGRRDHLWDKQTGDVRIEDPSNDIVVLMNINSKEGQVFKNGAIVSDSAAYFLEKGYSWWVNDAYWLVMPFKLKDTGVSLKYMREDSTNAGTAADVIRLSFEGVGLTPQNVYDVWIDIDSKLVTQWAYYPNAESKEPRFVTPWTNYRQHGKILLSGNRDNFQLTNINVLEEVPDDIFSNYDRPIVSLNP